MTAYITKDNILVTEATVEAYKAIVLSVPFDNTVDQRQKSKYHRAIALFLQHIICSATVSKNTKKKARFKGNKKWTYSVPFPAELGKEKFPMIFKQSRDLGLERGLECLEQAKIIKIIQHSYGTHKCREFALSKSVLKALFPGKRKDYLKRTDRYTYLTNIFDKCEKPETLYKLMLKSSYNVKPPKHKTSKHAITNPHFRHRIAGVYQQLEALPINLDKLQVYCNDHPTAKNKSFYFNFITHLMDVGVKIISKTPLIIEYRQAYKTAKVGSRSFEIGTGFQYLPSKMKWACLVNGYNYDIKGCQLAILEQEFKKYGISTDSLSVLETDFIKDTLGVDDNLVKTIRYGTIFNAGSVSLSAKGSMVKKLRKLYSDDYVSEILEHWKLETAELWESINQLIDEYLKIGKKNKYGLSVVNAAGQPFNTTKRKTKNEEWKAWRRDVMRRKLLAHMIQGLESRAVYDYVSSHSGVCALEHDGFVSLHELFDGDWQHEYLEIVLKHGC
ncbi:MULTISPECIES: hypothetical protein [Morganellaceae]|uniref:hypothetical protein n=1 Tax=Morganellaceae TaxID=1903414 RepID=UPI00209C8523|nr:MULTISPECIES: hypothetical protein [Morganellaceae]MDF7471173.1 hypothetical protein [Proteus mirabilis]UZE72454.1 hypothetical protein ONR66_08385 [Proteus mirabilis]